MIRGHEPGDLPTYLPLWIDTIMVRKVRTFLGRSDDEVVAQCLITVSERRMQYVYWARLSALLVA